MVMLVRGGGVVRGIPPNNNPTRIPVVAELPDKAATSSSAR